MSTVPDVPDAVVGWRAWTVRHTGTAEPQLVSAYQGSAWPAGEATVATCTVHGHHRPPATGCGCGLYGVVETGRVMLGADASTVLGCAAFWGDVIEGTHGWRASHGYPCLLIADPRLDEPTRARLAERYGVAVHRSQWPLCDVVTLLGTSLREQADGLRSGEVRWPDLTEEISRRLLRERAEREAAREREAADRRALARGVPWTEAVLAALVIVVAGAAAPVGIGALFGVLLSGVLRDSGVLPAILSGVFMAVPFGFGLFCVLIVSAALIEETFESPLTPWSFVDVWWVSVPFGGLGLVQVVLAALLGFQGWQAWSWGLVAFPAVIVCVCLSTMLPAPGRVPGPAR